MRVSTMRIAFAVALLLAPLTDAFVPPTVKLTSGGRAPFVGYHTAQKHVTSVYLFGGLKTKIKNLFKKAEEKAKELDEKIMTKTQELVKEADAALDDLADFVAEAAKNRTDAAIRAVAIETVRVLNGDWSVGIACNKSETSKLMEGAFNNVTDDLVALGLAFDNETESIKKDLKRSRLKWKTTFDASAYPLRVQNDIVSGTTKVISFYGTFQFDILEHNAVFAMDELIVLGVSVDLESIIEEVKAMEEEEEKGEDEEEDEEEEEGDDATVAEEAEVVEAKD